jgi:subtilisin family serine protease
MRAPRRELLLVGLVTAVATAGGAWSCGAQRVACVALGKRIGDAPLREGRAAATGGVRVLLSSNDPVGAEVRDTRPPEYVVLGLPEPREPELQRALLDEVSLPGGRYAIEPLTVEEESPAHSDLAPGDPAVDRPGWALQLIRYEAALGELARKRQDDERPSLAAAPPGTGVVIGHPDTGHTFHPALGRFDFGPALEGAPAAPLRPRDGYGFRDCSCNTFDLEVTGLTEGLRDPWHGTGTASVIVGPYARTTATAGQVGVRGVAPGAELIPLRTNTGVVIGEARGLQLAMAIRHAVSTAAPPDGAAAPAWLDACIRGQEECRRGTVGQDCSLVSRAVHVISISLGGTRGTLGRAFPFLESAVRRAERQGVIVVAAAGQSAEAGLGKLVVKLLHGGGVAYPGAFESAIGLAACNIRGRPWRASFRGPEVDLTAPGEGVWAAKFVERPGREAEAVVRPGKGTSYSTAITAGVAALWLDYHGRERLAERYGLAALPSVFKWVLVTRGFNTPAELCQAAKDDGLDYAQAICDAAKEGWDVSRYGPGILDAHKVLTAPLPSREELCGFVRNGIGGRWARSPEDARAICPS